MVADGGAPSQRRFSVCAVRIGGGAPKYALFFTFTSEAREAMVEKTYRQYNRGLITTNELWAELELIEIGFYDKKEQ